MTMCATLDVRWDTERSSLIKTVNGQNPTKRMDVVLYLYDRALSRLGDIVVVDPRAIDMNQYATGEGMNLT
jgi:hypothetical protein